MAPDALDGSMLRAHLSVTPCACALGCNRQPHRTDKDAPQVRLADDQHCGPDTRDARCRSGVPRSPFCHGDPGEIGRSRIPMALTRDVKTRP